MTEFYLDTDHEQLKDNLKAMAKKLKDKLSSPKIEWVRNDLNKGILDPGDLRVEVYTKRGHTMRPYIKISNWFVVDCNAKDDQSLDNFERLLTYPCLHAILRDTWTNYICGIRVYVINAFKTN